MRTIRKYALSNDIYKNFSGVKVINWRQKNAPKGALIIVF